MKMNLGKILRNLAANQQRWERMVDAAARMQPARNENDRASNLESTLDFGSNPGALRMFSYRPAQIPAESALVVVLHGCTQTATGYDHGAGWSTLADRYGFSLLLPEQQRSNNPKGCFNWFQKGDIERGRGEALSIRQMIEKMACDHDIDRRRVFVTGLSAGGAMTSVMLATYPDVFTGGAIIAGLPYGAANNVQQAFESMFKSPPRSARAWGDLVRGASPHHGPWPRVSVWHGGADAIVTPSNASEIIKQWTDVHGLSGTPTSRETVDSYSRQVWRNGAGEDVIEAYTIPKMSHGTPLAVGNADDQCGAAGAFLLEMGISSSYHIAKFWGLIGAPQTAIVQKHQRIEMATDHLSTKERVDEAFDASAGSASPSSSTPIDIHAVITDALKAAGLMKAS